jgi:hypothetical protein
VAPDALRVALGHGIEAALARRRLHLRQGRGRKHDLLPHRPNPVVCVRNRDGMLRASTRIFT